MLTCFPRCWWSLISIVICLGVRRPCLKACSLLMNLIAMMGFGALCGTALRTLLGLVSETTCKDSLEVLTRHMRPAQ